MNEWDFSKIKVGDEVTVRFIVARVAPRRIFPRIDSGATSYTYFEAGDVIGHTPKPKIIEVGAPAKTPSGLNVKIVAFEASGKGVCVRTEGGDLMLIHADALELVQ